jgi:hypothetical protein
MQPPYADTTSKVTQVWLEHFWNMTPGEKIATVFELIRFARDMAAAGVRSRHPNADEPEVFLRVAALHLARNEMLRAYHWDPRDHDDSERAADPST